MKNEDAITADAGGARADLHVHSRYSDRPSEWFLRRIGAPESFVAPGDLYRDCRARGMDFVTISDHNSIRGALEIADRPGVFLSSELTTYFPEDGCKIHCLVSGITEAQFVELQTLRKNLYELRRYLRERDIVHTIAHPLFRVNDRLTPDHVEKLLALFPRFEIVNGSRDPRAGLLLRAICDALTPEFIARLADRHGLEPAGLSPARKWLTGGSDDHSGLYSAHTWTVTPPAANVEEFLAHLRAGRHAPGGAAGASLKLAHSLYQISYSYYRHRFLRGSSEDRTLIGAMLRKLVEPDVPAAERRGWSGALRRGAGRFAGRWRRRRLNDMERLLVDEFSALRARRAARGEQPALAAAGPEEAFQSAARLSQQLVYAFLTRGVERLRHGGLIEGLQSLAALGPVLLGVTPYLTAFFAQHKDAAFLRAMADRFPGAVAPRPRRRAWLTDTFDDVNGVAHTIRTLAGLAHARGDALTVVTCRPQAPAADFPLRNFEPVGVFQLPEYESLPVAFPPFLDLLRYLEREGFDEIILSTPGPLGVAGRLAARVLGLPVVGLYHTDFPSYVRQLTEDDGLGELARSYMRWFYGDMERVLAPSESFCRELRDLGLPPDRVSVLPRGVDRARFHPDRRDPTVWATYGLNGGFKFLYVGRVSAEKNLEPMFAAHARLRASGLASDLIVVGDGPARAELSARYAASDVLFTGYLGGDELARAYAAADAFVFPSRTDTFGNAVLEAHACGLPAIVGDRGGPPEIVRRHTSGLVVDTRAPEHLADAMRRLATDGALRERLRTGALRRASDPEAQWGFALDCLTATGPVSAPAA